MATNRLPAVGRTRHDNSTINLEIGARSQTACCSTLTLAQKMTFDIESDLGRVRDFVSKTIVQFAASHGKASILRLDVQAVHGQIHAYPSTTHDSETIYDDIGKPIEYCFDEESWTENYYAGHLPIYKGRIYDAKFGDADYNEVFSLMITDATKKAIEAIPCDALPKEILIEAAIESGGSYAEIIKPNEEANKQLDTNA